MKKVAVTGQVASGKTTVCQILKELGAYVLNADAIVHQLLSDDDGIKKQIANLLGEEILVDGKVDRKAIAERVFTDNSLLLALEKILHPKVQKAIDKEFKEISQSHYSLFVVEIPLLFEGGFEKEYDTILLVTTHEEKGKKRFVAKGFQEEEYAKRTLRLLPISEKIAKSDFIIENNGSYEELKSCVTNIYKNL